MCTFSCWNLRSRFDSSQYFGPLTRSSLPLDARNRPYQEVDKWHFLLLEARLLDWMNEGAFTWASQLRSNNFLTQSRVTWVKRTWLDWATWEAYLEISILGRVCEVSTFVVCLALSLTTHNGGHRSDGLRTAIDVIKNWGVTSCNRDRAIANFKLLLCITWNSQFWQILDNKFLDSPQNAPYMDDMYNYYAKALWWVCLTSANRWHYVGCLCVRCNQCVPRLELFIQVTPAHWRKQLFIPVSPFLKLVNFCLLFSKKRNTISYTLYFTLLHWLLLQYIGENCMISSNSSGIICHPWVIWFSQSDVVSLCFILIH